MCVPVIFFNIFFVFSGESMENALRACCKGIKIGKILIHREGDNGQQVWESFYVSLLVLYQCIQILLLAVSSTLSLLDS